MLTKIKAFLKWWHRSTNTWCDKHTDSIVRRWIGCEVCWSESIDKYEHRKREEKIELIKEAILRADLAKAMVKS